MEQEFSKKSADSGPTETQSYSKMVNYLIALGIDKYNDLIKHTGNHVTPPHFEFDKYTRHAKAQPEALE